MKRKNRVETLLSESKNFDAFVVKSPADIAYLIGIVFPYPDQSPFSAALVACKGNNKYTLIIPVEWECVLPNFTWKGLTRTYSINDGDPDTAFRGALKSVLESMEPAGKNIGIDYSSWTVAEIRFLKETFDGTGLVDIDPELSAAREIKSAEEIVNIKLASHIADRGMIGALNHVEGTIGTAEYTRAEFLERIRVHAIEFGANCTGHLNLSEGRSGRSWLTPIRDLSFTEDGHTIRADYSVCMNGCWTVCSRMFFTGKPDQAAVDAYADNMMIKNFAVDILKPGIRVSEFCEAVRLKAEEECIELMLDEGLGHGVGMSEHEKPFLTADNDEVLKPNMVIALDIKTIGSVNEMIHSIDIYQLTRDGNVKLSDFREWNTMYLINGMRSTH